MYLMEAFVASEFFKTRKDGVKLAPNVVTSLFPASRLRRGDTISVIGDRFWVSAMVVQMIVSSCPCHVHVYDASLKFHHILKDTLYVPIFSPLHLKLELSKLLDSTPPSFLVICILSDSNSRQDLEISRFANCAIITNFALADASSTFIVSGSRLSVVSRNREPRYLHLEISTCCAKPFRMFNQAKSDPSSFSDLNSAITKHIDIDWVIDFARQKIHGSVELTIDIICGSCKDLILDTRDLEISTVSVKIRHGQFSRADYSILKAHETLGSPLLVKFPAPLSQQQVVIRVEYATTAQGSALKWLLPGMTSTEHPFVYSQCQAIHARSLLPCQDSCAAKVTFTANVRSPKNLKVLMSAVEVCGLPLQLTDEISETRFRQNIPIPTYLIALVCGDLEMARVGPRCRVWAEPCVLAAAAAEFSETEKILEAAESICGPYKFGIYDLLVLPGSFPYGGMENPCLTFVTPTLLAGDKSLTAVVAHEIAHSWSGNLATNENWEYFWLNEGLTVFIEQKIIGKLWGEEEMHLHMQQAWFSLHSDVHDKIGASHDFTCLCPDLHGGKDPDDAFSTVPYYKGCSFFWFLQEEVLGSSDRMEFFLKEYFTHFTCKTVSFSDFRNFFSANFQDEAKLVPWAAWVRTPGMPLFKIPFDPSYAFEAEALANTWLSAAADLEIPFPDTAPIAWSSAKLGMFLKCLKEGGLPKMVRSKEACEVIDEAFHFTRSNAELRCAFLLLALDSGCTSMIPVAVKMLETQGRMKYTRPLYRALKSSMGVEAKKIFEANILRYHPICSKMVSRDFESL